MKNVGYILNLILNLIRQDQINYLSLQYLQYKQLHLLEIIIEKVRLRIIYGISSFWCS